MDFMVTVVLTIIVVFIAVLAMSAGTLFGSRTIKGPCGGESSVPGVTCVGCIGHCDVKGGGDSALSKQEPRGGIDGED